MANLQTLEEFIRKPFGRTDVGDKVGQYLLDYNKAISSEKIRLVAWAESEGAYYYHVALPSQSVKSSNYNYDVVIRFFALDEKTEKSATLINYYVQFFSNSPSFIYKYAVLYKRNGMLIESLYDKMSEQYRDTLPEKANASMEVSFDKSIWFASKFLLDHRFRYLNKVGTIVNKKKSLQQFLRGIRDVETVQLERMLISEEKKLAKDEKRYKEQRKEGKITKKRDISRKLALQDTLRDKSNPGIRVVRAGSSTSGRSNGKITAKKTTSRKY